MDEKAIGNRIAELRKAQGMTQIEMARKLSVDRNTLRNIEKSSTAIINEHLPAIAEILGISEEKLILGYEPCHPGDMDTLEDVRASYSRQIRDINDAHEDKIGNLKAQLAAKDDIIKALRQQIETKDEVITLLKKRKKS